MAITSTPDPGSAPPPRGRFFESLEDRRAFQRERAAKRGDLATVIAEVDWCIALELDPKQWVASEKQPLRLLSTFTVEVRASRPGEQLDARPSDCTVIAWAIVDEEREASRPVGWQETRFVEWNGQPSIDIRILFPASDLWPFVQGRPWTPRDALR